MVPNTREQVMDFLQALRGERPDAYLGFEMKTWLVKEHEVMLAGRENSSFFGVFGDGRYVLFDRDPPEAKPVVLSQGHTDDVIWAEAPRADDGPGL